MSASRARWVTLPWLAALPLGGCGLLTGDAFDVTLATGLPDASSLSDVGDAIATDATDAPAAPFRGMVAAGTSHTCAVLAGSASCWGLGADGELGNGGIADRSAAVAVAGLGAGVAQLAAGAKHTCAVMDDGGVQCWGANGKGQIGQPLTSAQRLVPTRVPLGSAAVEVALGDVSTCALMKDGGVQCWGGNDSGQLGDGKQALTGDPAPVRVTGLAGVTAIAAGASHVCAVVSGGVRCWGWNHFNQIGDGSIDDRWAPVQVPGLSNVVAVTAGAQHTCALTSGGAVSCWGANDSGQLGDGSTTQRPTPVAVAGLASGVKAIAAGQLHTCALEADGVHCWGHNTHGALGNNGSDDSNVPFAVPVGLIATSVLSLAAGGDHACVLTAAKQVQCWGSNLDGELGNGGSPTDSRFPVRVVGL